MRKFDKISPVIAKKLAGVEVLIQSERFRDGLAELEKFSPAFNFETISEEAAIYHYFKGFAYWKLGEKKRGYASAQKALEMYLALRHFEGIAKSQKLVGSLFIDLGNLKLAREHLEIAVSTFKLSNRPEQAARALNQMAYLHIVQGNLKEALQYVEQSKGAALKANDRYYATVQDGVASVCYRLLGNWKLALSVLRDFLTEAQKKGDFFNYVHGLINWGHSHFLKQSFTESRQSYLKAIHICESENLVGNLKIACEFLAELDTAEKRFRESEENLKKAMAIGERVSPYGTVMTQTWRKMGDLYNAKGEPQNALKAYETCESYLIKLPEELERGACFVGRGVAFSRLKNWRDSQDSFDRAFDVFDQCENDWEKAKAVVVAVETGAYSVKQLETELWLAKEIFHKLEHPAWVERVHKVLEEGELSQTGLPLWKKMERMKRAELLTALEKTAWNKSQAAKVLGITEGGIRWLIKQYGLEK